MKMPTYTRIVDGPTVYEVSDAIYIRCPRCGRWRFARDAARQSGCMHMVEEEGVEAYRCGHTVPDEIVGKIMML